MTIKVRDAVWLAAFLAIGATARAEIVLQENFEGNGSSCAIRGTYTEVYRINVDGTNPRSGRCSGWHHYGGDEDAAYLRHRGPQATSNVLHGTYWVYYSNSGAWPRHQKMNRFYIGSSENSGQEYFGVLHPFGNGGVRMTYASAIPEPPVGNRTCRLADGAGCSCTVFDMSGAFSTGEWHSVEFLVEMRGGATEGTCNGAQDVIKVWLDGSLVINRDDFNLSNGNSGYSFQNFWLFGNSSAEQGQCDASGNCKTVYFDDICIATTAGECGGLASAGTSGEIPPDVQNVRRTDARTP